MLQAPFHPYRTPSHPRHYQLHGRAGTGVAAFSFSRSRRPTLARYWGSLLLLPYACHSRMSDLPLLLAAAVFSVEILALLDERRVIDEGIVSVPLPPVSNPASPPPLPTPRACCNRCDGLLFWWRRRPSLAWCWRRSLLLPCACHSRMNDLRLLLATTMRSRYASRALTRAPIPAQEYGWAC